MRAPRAAFFTLGRLAMEEARRAAPKSACGPRVPGLGGLQALWHGLGLEPDPMCAGYYCELDLMVWARQHYGAEFADFLLRHYEPADIVFRLAEKSCIVLMQGAGFAGPEWSLRVSLANLPEAAYARIGAQLKAAAQAYVRAWRASRPARRRR